MLLSSPALAADPCRGVKTKKDAFGQTRGEMRFNMYKLGAVGLVDTGGETVLQTRWGVYSVVNASIPAGAVVDIALEDGTTASLTAPAPSAARAMEWNGALVTTWYVNTPVDDETLAALSRSDLAAARMEVQGELQTMNVFPAGRKQVANAAACFASD